MFLPELGKQIQGERDLSSNNRIIRISAGSNNRESTVVSSIADAATEVLPAAGQALKDTSEAAGGLLHSAFGGLWNLIQSIFIIAILAAVVYLLWNNPSVRKFFKKRIAKKVKRSIQEIEMDKVDNTKQNVCPMHAEKDSMVIYPPINEKACFAPPYMEVIQKEQ